MASADGVSVAGSERAAPDRQSSSEEAPSQEQKQSREKRRLAADSVTEFLYGSQLGEGAFARHRATRKHFAVKILDKRHIWKSGKSQSVMVERQVMASAKHPNIVSIVSSFTTPDELYIVLNLCRGGTLFDMMLSHKREAKQEDRAYIGLPPQATQFYIAQILCALEYLHTELRVVHRDVKPENALLDDRGFVRLADFGSARVEASSPLAPALDRVLHRARRGGRGGAGGRMGHHRAVEESEFVGTPEYLAPEIIADEAAHAAADLWSLGCILFQCCTGRPPFQDELEWQTMQRISRFVSGDEPLHIPEHVPEEARSLILRLLLANPRERLCPREEEGSETNTNEETATPVADSAAEQGPPPPAADGEEEAANGGEPTTPRKDDEPSQEDIRRAYSQLKSHPFFAGIDWDAMRRGQVTAPIRPRLLQLPQPASVSPLSWEALGEGEPLLMTGDSSGTADSTVATPRSQETLSAALGDSTPRAGEISRGDSVVEPLTPAGFAGPQQQATEEENDTEDVPFVEGGWEDDDEETWHSWMRRTPAGDPLPREAWEHLFWSNWLHVDEHVLMWGPVSKKAGFFSRVLPRILVLVRGPRCPRLFYFEPERRRHKGTIYWDPEMQVRVRDDVRFSITAANMTYQLWCHRERAKRWVACMQLLLEPGHAGVEPPAADIPALVPNPEAV